MLTAETVDRIEKTLAASSGGMVIVDISGGRIEVSSAAGSEVRIDIERKVTAGSKEEEERYLAERKVTITQEGNTVRIHQEKPKDTGSWIRGWFNGGGRKVDSRFTIVVPPEFNADLDTSGGSISVRDLTGEVRADTSGGSIKCENIMGPVDADTSGGSITLARCHGDSRADTSGGSITAEDGSGALSLDTSGGSIRVRNHRGNVDADTSGGSITFERVEGNVSGNTSGGSIRASLVSAPTDDCRLSTSGGGIHVDLPASAAVDIDAATSGGRVRCDFEVAGHDSHKKSSTMRGALNGGGPLLHLRTSGGGISISKAGT